MKPILFINPMKPGKFGEYKAFVAEITGPKKSEFMDLLKRHHLNTSEVWHHQLGNLEYVIVYHEVDDNAPDPLASWASSSHPFDKWFQEQLNNLHDMEGVKLPELLFHIDAT